MTSKNINVLDLNVRYIETDGRMDIPLIILHGWGSSIKSWTNVASSLEDGDIKVFIPDLPGFGETPEPPQAWGCTQYLDFIRAFVRELGVAKFALGGHSFGGQLAIAYAAKYPQDLHKLILLAAARIMRRKKVRVKIFLIFATIGSTIFSVPFLCTLKPVVQKIWHKLTGETDYYRASPLMKETMRLVVGEEVSSRLESIKTPTLILWGGKDDVTPLTDAKIIHHKIPDSTLHIFEGVGHDLNFKKPREVAQKIVEFITHHEGGQL